MKVDYECASCMLRQSREAIEHATEDNNKRMKVTLKVLDFMNKHFKENTNSNKLGTDLHHLIMDETGNKDPYKVLRQQGNVLATKLIPNVLKFIEDNPTFETFVKIAVVGNIIDFGALEENTDMESMIKNKISDELIINDIECLRNDLENANKILYLADNGGEIVFDKLLLEKIKKDYNLEIVLALKEGPILNDALISDAVDLSLDEFATIISTGAASVGVVEKYISNELKDLICSVDLIISKGMGNYEGLTEMDISTPIYFLLTTKCNVISEHIGVPLGSTVVLKN